MDAGRKLRRARAWTVPVLVAAVTLTMVTLGGDAGQAATTTTTTTRATGTTSSPPSTTTTRGTTASTTRSTTTGSPVPPAAVPPNLTLTFEDGSTGGLVAAPGVTLATSTDRPYSGARSLQLTGPATYGTLARLPLGDLDPHRTWSLSGLTRGGVTAPTRNAITWEIVVGGQVVHRADAWLYAGWTSFSATVPAWTVPAGPAELVLSTYRCPTYPAAAPTSIWLDDLQVKQADAASDQPSAPPAAPAAPDCPRDTAALDQLAPGTTVASWDFEDGSTQGWSIGDPATVPATVSNTDSFAASGRRSLYVNGLRVSDQDRGPGLRRQETGRLPVGAYRLSAKVRAVTNGAYPGLEGVVSVPATQPTVSTGWATQLNQQGWVTLAVPFRFEDNATWSAAVQVWNRAFCLPGGAEPISFVMDDVTLVYEGASGDPYPPADLPVAVVCPDHTSTSTTTTSSTTTRSTTTTTRSSSTTTTTATKSSTSTTSRTTTTNHAGPGCRVRHTVEGQWPDGFIAQVVLTSTEATPKGWTLSWSYPGGQRVTALWGAAWAQSAATVSVRNPDTGIAAGGTVQLGLLGRRAAGDPAPTGFALNGRPCTS